MIQLVFHYHNIRWDKLSPVVLTSQIAATNHYNRYKENIPGLTIDNTFNVYFTHYLYDPVAKHPTKKGVDIYYYKNYEIGVKKYYKRISRMLMDNEPPHFLIVAYSRHGWNINTLNQLVQGNCDDKITIITDELVTAKHSNTTIIYDPQLNTPYLESPRKVVEKYLTSIVC
jgi:hypothetical protein